MTQSPGLIATIKEFASSLRFPYLVLLTASLFVVDLLIPDFIPFADEIFLALLTLVMASFKKKCLEAVLPPDTVTSRPVTFEATASHASPRDNNSTPSS